MHAPRVRFTVRRMILAVAFLALVAALVAQERNADRRVAALEAELNSVRTLISSAGVFRDTYSCDTKVEAVGDRIVIASVAELTDQGDVPTYVWAVRISDHSSKDVVFSRRYDNRVVRPLRGKRASAPFTEILRPSLPPGDYHVHVSLLAVPPDKGLSGLDDEKNYARYEILSSEERVTIGLRPRP